MMIEDTEPAPSDDPVITGKKALGGAKAERDTWLESISGLLKARVGIISLEAKEALGIGLAKLIPLLVCVFCLLSAWVLAITASIGCLAAATDWKWHQITFVMAGAHLLIAVIALLIAKRRKPAPFPVTRSEFEKDREWLIQLKNRNN